MFPLMIIDLHFKIDNIGDFADEVDDDIENTNEIACDTKPDDMDVSHHKLQL